MLVNETFIGPRWVAVSFSLGSDTGTSASYYMQKYALYYYSDNAMLCYVQDRVKDGEIVPLVGDLGRLEGIVSTVPKSGNLTVLS